MYALGPEFIDVTWGAGGSTASLTMELCQTAQSVYGLETCMHLTCTNMPTEQIDAALKVCPSVGRSPVLLNISSKPRKLVSKTFSLFVVVRWWAFGGF